MTKRSISRKFKWFWAWQDEAEEKWLGDMAKKGYHLSSVALPGIYTFIVDEPRNYIYRLDYQTFHKKDKREYLQLFEDAGWEHVGEMSAWQYFRKEAKPGEINEIFTDVESKISKYKRVLAYAGFFFIILIAIFAGRVPDFVDYPWWGTIPSIIIFLVMVLLTVVIFKLARRIRQLKQL